jgi:hypothetical protein
MKRNLIYFICPLSHTNVWRQNVEKLSRYLDCFNGRMIVTIAEGENCVPSDEVIKAFPARYKIEFLTAPNDKAVGETPHFVKMAKIIESKDSDEITFYAHAKGVSYANPSSSYRIWCDKMYHHNLADFELIEHIFDQEYDSIGCFRRKSHRVGKDRGHTWHFSGTFFWFRHSKTFIGDWENVVTKDCRWGVEGFLGKVMPIEKSFCIYGEEVARIGKRVHLATRKEMWQQDKHFFYMLRRMGWEKEFPVEIETDEIINIVSDAIFAQNMIKVNSEVDPGKFSEKFDIAYVSGYTYEESSSNYDKALSLLSPKGVIVMNGAWAWEQKGDAYKTVVDAFTDPEVQGCTVNSDKGISVIWKPKPLVKRSSVTHTKLKRNPHLVHLVDCCDLDLLREAIRRDHETSTNIRHSQRP